MPQVFLYVRRSLCVWDAVLGCVVVGLDTGVIVSECWYLCSDCSGWFMPLLLSVCLAAAWVHVRARAMSCMFLCQGTALWGAPMGFPQKAAASNPWNL